MKTKLTKIAIALVAIMSALSILPLMDITSLNTKQTESEFEDSNNSQATNEDSNLTSTNEKLIEKNIDFLKENIEILQNQTDTTKIEDNNTIKQEQIEPTKRESTQNTNEDSCNRAKPQLAIIIDDVATMQQYNSIKSIPFKLTPSIFPRSKATPNTPQIAKQAPFFMVHLPLEALNFYQKGHRWILTSNTKEEMQTIIDEIKRDFPRLEYINNHTGSKFTQTYESLEKLLDILNNEKITFLDSRTSSKTQSAKYYANHNITPQNKCQSVFLKRDIFLDNELDIPKITQNIIDSINLAKKRGYAIAIGHPHKETILALKNATNYIKDSGVELVYVNELVIK